MCKVKIDDTLGGDTMGGDTMSGSVYDVVPMDGNCSGCSTQAGLAPTVDLMLFLTVFGMLFALRRFAHRTAQTARS